MSNYFITNCNRDYQTRNHSKISIEVPFDFRGQIPQKDYQEQTKS